MKKMNLAALLMAGALSFSLLAGCSNNDSDPTTTPAGDTTESQAVESEPAESQDVADDTTGADDTNTGDDANTDDQADAGDDANADAE